MRTETGRSKELQEKAPEANVELNAEDAENYGIKGLIKIRRGAIQVPATISKIVKGQIFIPFHYGYWDKANGSTASAANELTFGTSKS
jgi:predicted molibdopterin-dependent oxidoreductase YjgC